MNVPEVLLRYAHYNRSVNRTLVALLEPLAPRWTEPNGGYFKSLQGLLNHLVASDVVWFHRFRENDWGTPEWKAKVDAIPRRAYGDPYFQTWDEFVELRERCDQLWIEFVEAIDEDRLDEPWSYKTFQGKHITLPWGGVFLHLFNHQTHHRGALSQILDEAGIDNDFSGLSYAFAD